MSELYGDSIGCTALSPQALSWSIMSATWGACCFVWKVYFSLIHSTLLYHTIRTAICILGNGNEQSKISVTPNPRKTPVPFIFTEGRCVTFFSKQTGSILPTGFWKSHQLVNSSLAHRVLTTLNTQSSVYFTSSHTPQLPNLGHRMLLFFDVCNQYECQC